MKRMIKDSSTWKLLVCTILAILLYLFLNIRYSLFTVPELKIHDFFVRTCASFKQAPEVLDDIVVVAIDNDSIDFSNMRWPWRRGFIADILTELDKGRPNALFFDFVLSGRSEYDEDKRLQSVIDSLGNVMIASFVDEDGLLVLPHPIFVDSAYTTGFVNNPFDDDSIIRRSRVMLLSRLSLDERVGEYSGMMKMLMFDQGLSFDDLRYWPKEQLIDSVIETGEAFPLPLNDERYMEINFSFMPKELTVVPAWKIFRGQADPKLFENKLVLFGATSELTHDTYKTPLGLLPGIYIKAYELATMLSGEYIKAVPTWIEYSVLAIILFMIALFSYRFVLGRGFIMFAFILGAYYFVYLFLVWNNVRADALAPLLVGATIYVGANFYKQVRLRHDINKLQLLAVTDSITGLYVRRYFQLRLQYEWSHSKKTRSVFSLLMMDIDFFKKINDTYGHLCGDMVLEQVSRLIQDCCRKVDIICRYGGEEFAVILPQTDNEGAKYLAEKIRTTIEKYKFTYEGQNVQVTTSCGVSTYGRIQAEAPEELIAQADDCLYKAKESGRNKVVSC